MYRVIALGGVFTLYQIFITNFLYIFFFDFFGSGWVDGFLGGWKKDGGGGYREGKIWRC
jgi:hypothetical protein